MIQSVLEFVITLNYVWEICVLPLQLAMHMVIIMHSQSWVQAYTKNTHQTNLHSFSKLSKYTESHYMPVSIYSTTDVCNTQWGIGNTELLLSSASCYAPCRSIYTAMWIAEWCNRFVYQDQCFARLRFLFDIMQLPHHHDIFSTLRLLSSPSTSPMCFL